MTPLKRFLAKSLMVAAVVSAVVSVGLFAAVPAGSLRVIRPQWPEPGVLLWDTALSLLFFVQHSGMLRKGFRAWSARIVAEPFQRAVYAVASGIVLTAVVVLWQPTDRHLLALDGVARWIVRAGPVLAIAVFAWGGFSMRSVDLFGLAPIRAWLSGSSQEQPARFVAAGPYRWVRHPWYSSAILLIWSCPDLTSDRLLFCVLWTAWICLGAKLEEADLLRDFGGAYEEYRRKVPMLIPWRGPVVL